MDINRDPVRKIPLPFAGDPWAQAGAQAAIPDDVQRLVVTQQPLRVRVVGYDGTGPNAAPVDATSATADFTVVKLRPDKRGNVTLARTVSLVEATGGEVAVGAKQITEDDVTPNEIVCIGIPSATTGDSAALWVFVDSGCKYKGGSRGQA